MASIGNDSGGRKRILFVANDGSRKTIRLGKCSTKQARTHLVCIEDLIAAARGAKVIENTTATWLADLDKTLHERLAGVGLVKPREATEQAKLGPFFDAFVARLKVKPATLLNFKQLRNWMVDHFGEQYDLRRLGHAEAEDFQAHMQKKLGDNTVRRHIGRARQVFKSAIRRGVYRGANPFGELDATVKADASRLFFVTRDIATKVIDACPDAQWKLIVALSRYGGLRCPSEHLSLKWGHINWAEGRIQVPSPKTEHIEGLEWRMIPLFPELRPLLQAVYDEAEEGAEYVITRYRVKNCNLRTQLLKIIARAGLTPWPKLFHNMRATRETELMDQFPAHVVVAWIGNTEEVARRHYLQVRDTHFIQASQPAEQAAQNPAQQPPEVVGNARKELQPVRGDAEVSAVSGASGWPLSESKSEPLYSENQHNGGWRGTPTGTIDGELAEVVATWPKLPAEVRASILALIRS